MQQWCMHSGTRFLLSIAASPFNFRGHICMAWCLSSYCVVVSVVSKMNRFQASRGGVFIMHVFPAHYLQGNWSSFSFLCCILQSETGSKFDYWLALCYWRSLYMNMLWADFSTAYSHAGHKWAELQFATGRTGSSTAQPKEGPIPGTTLAFIVQVFNYMHCQQPALLPLKTARVPEGES